MNRLALLNKLDVVAPALSRANLIPILQHFCFTGTDVYAYNDRIAISTPCKTVFTGAVPGVMLLELLRASRAKEVELTAVTTDGYLAIKAASSHFQLGLQSAKSFVFEMPAGSKVHGQKASKNLFDAIELCLNSVSTDTSYPDYLGITFRNEDNRLGLYSTNGVTIMFGGLALKDDVGLAFKHAILSGDFCVQMLALGKKEQGSMSLLVNPKERYALFTCPSATLYGQLIETDKPMDYRSKIEQHSPSDLKRRLISIPSKLKLILERSLIVTQSKEGTPKMSVTIRDGVCKFASRSDNGEVLDTMQVEPNQPDVSIKINPKMLKSGVDLFDRMLFTKTCVIMTNGRMTYLVAVSQD